MTGAAEKIRHPLVAFDLDGTLADSYPWFAATLPQVAARYGFRAPAAEEAEALRHCGAAEILRRLGVARWKLPCIARHMRRRKAAAAIPLFPGVPGMLARLHAAGVVLAVVSSDAEANARATLGPVAAMIRHWGCGASLFGKPAKLRRLPPGGLYVGDELRDAAAARAAGMGFAAVAWGYTRPEALAAVVPLHLFRSPDEIAALLGAPGLPS